MKPLQRYDGHRSHIKNERIKRMLQLIDKDEDFESFIRLWFLPRLFGYPTLNSFLLKVKEAGSMSAELVVGSIVGGGPERFMLEITHSEFKLKGDNDDM